MTVRDPGIYVDGDLSMRSHVQQTVARCFPVLRQLRSVRRSVPTSVFQTLVVTLALWKLDCAVLHWLASLSGRLSCVADMPFLSRLSSSTSSQILSVRRVLMSQLENDRLLQLAQSYGFFFRWHYRAYVYFIKLDRHTDNTEIIYHAASRVVKYYTNRQAFITALHVMQTRYSDENSVRLSVRPSVGRSVCLSHVWIVTKRKKDLPRFLYHTKNNLA